MADYNGLEVWLRSSQNGGGSTVCETLCQLLDLVSTNYTISEDDEQAINPSFSQENWVISLRLTKLLAFLSIPRLISSFQSKDRVNRADQEKKRDLPALHVNECTQVWIE